MFIVILDFCFLSKGMQEVFRGWWLQFIGKIVWEKIVGNFYFVCLHGIERYTVITLSLYCGENGTLFNMCCTMWEGWIAVRRQTVLFYFMIIINLKPKLLLMALSLTARINRLYR